MLPRDTSSPPSLGTKASLGLSGVVESTQFQIYELFLIFYYAQVLGLSGALAGLAVALATIADAFTDPLIGSYSDGFRGRHGRRHTLMFLAILPLAVLIYLLFSPPAGLGQLALFAWLLGLCIAVRVASSFYSVPAAAAGAELTQDASQRAELGIWRQGTAALVQIALMWMIVNLALTPTPEHDDGRFNPDGYSKLALLMGAVLAICALVGALGTRRRTLAFEQQQLVARPAKLSIVATLRRAWGALLEVGNFRALFLGLLFAGIMGSYFRALNLHLGTYFWQLTTAQTGAWFNSMQAAMFVTALASRLAVGRIEPKTLYVSGVAIMLCSYVLPPALRLLEMLPANGSATLVTLLYAANMGVGIGTGLIMTCSLVLFAETADEYAYVKGESRTGMLLAFLPLGNKLASSFGKVLAGFVIQWIAFPVGQPAAEVDPGSLRTLGLAAVGVTLLAGVTSLFFYLRYHLPRARHAEILRGLAAMREASRVRGTS